VEFWTLTQRALDYCFERFPSVDRKLRGDLLSAYLKLDAYPDARTLLEALKARGERTAILTNGSPAMVASAVEAAGLKSVLDAVLSVDTVKMFKPRPEVYALVTKEFSCKPSDVVFVSSNRWMPSAPPRSVSARSGSPRQGAGRIPGIPAGRGRIRPDRRAVGPLTGTISGNRPCRRPAATASRPTRSRISSSRPA